MIKDDKQNHLLVISICHGTAFAISRTSLKNISKWWRRRGLRTFDAWERLRGEEASAEALGARGGKEVMGWGVLVNEGALRRDGSRVGVKNNTGDVLVGISGLTGRCWPVWLVPTTASVITQLDVDDHESKNQWSVTCTSGTTNLKPRLTCKTPMFYCQTRRKERQLWH